MHPSYQQKKVYLDAEQRFYKVSGYRQENEKIHSLEKGSDVLY